MGRVLEPLRELLILRPWTVIVVALLSLAPAGLGTARLTVKTSFSELLPSSRPSVMELDRIKHRLAGSSSLVVVAEGRVAASLRRFVSELSPRIAALGPDY